MFSCELCEIFKNTFFLRTLPVAASVQLYLIWMNSKASHIDFYYWFENSCYAEQFYFRLTFKLSTRRATFWNSYFSEQLFFRTAIFQNSYLQEQPPEVFLQKKLILKNWQYSLETPVLESIFLIKLQAFRTTTLLERESNATQVLSCEYFENFKKSYFEEHLQTAAFVLSTKSPPY